MAPRETRCSLEYSSDLRGERKVLLAFLQRAAVYCTFSFFFLSLSCYIEVRALVSPPYQNIYYHLIRRPSNARRALVRACPHATVEIFGTNNKGGGEEVEGRDEERERELG